MPIFKNKLIIILIFTVSIISVGAQNLVSNHSFESHNYPGVDNGFYEVHGWGAHLTCDLHYDGLGGTGMNDESGWGFQEPFSGNAMAGIRAFNDTYDEWHEFIYTKLDEPLEAGELYFVSFMVSPCERALYATDDIGLCLSSIKPIGSAMEEDTHVFYENYIPQIQNPQGRFFNNVTLWYEVNGYYKAKGDEQRLIIGNFKPDSMSSASALWENILGRAAYLFIDHVVVEKCPIPICFDFPTDTTLCGESTITIDASSEGVDTYTWSDGSHDPVFTIDAPGDYKVTALAGGCRLSKTIHVEDINDFSLGKDTIICNKSDLVLNPQLDNANYLWNNTSTDSKYKINESGLYWVEVNTDECLYRDTIDVKYIDDFTNLYPNPNNGVFQFESSLETIESIRLFESSGKLIGSNQNIDELKADFDIRHNGASSLYLLEVETSGCKLRKKVVVLPR